MDEIKLFKVKEQFGFEIFVGGELVAYSRPIYPNEEIARATASDWLGLYTKVAPFQKEVVCRKIIRGR